MQNSSLINVYALSFILVMCALIVILPRNKVHIPFFMGTFYVTLGQKIVIKGMDFSMLRILILFLLIRILCRREYFNYKMNSIDVAFFLWIFIGSILYLFSHQYPGALMNRMGRIYDAVGIYFIFRILVQNEEDIILLIKSLAIIIIPIAILMIFERTTGRNFFSLLGGVAEFTHYRFGTLRCQGPFSIHILAGTFGATLIPYFLALFINKKYKVACCGLIAGTIITICSASSGPALSYIFCLIAMCLFPLRRFMRFIRWGLLVALVLLHFVMEAPVWYLIAKISYIIGGTGFHRSYLIDQAINYFGEWWLCGTDYTAHWMPTVLAVNPDMADITNQFIAEGTNGGMLRLLLFIAILVLCFKSIGRYIRLTQNVSFKIFAWALGSALFTHIVSFMSVSYFDQIIVSYYALLAMIATLYSLQLKKDTIPTKILSTI